RADIALALGRDLGCFRDDESGAGPLGVIQRAQRGGHVAGARAASSQGRHDNTVRQRERSYFDGGEEIPRGLSGVVLHEAILLRREDVNGTTPPIAVTTSQGEFDELLWNIKTVIQTTICHGPGSIATLNANCFRRNAAFVLLLL